MKYIVVYLIIARILLFCSNNTNQQSKIKSADSTSIPTAITDNKLIKLNPDIKSIDLYFVPEEEFNKAKYANKLPIL
jgi:hypothetical protein